MLLHKTSAAFGVQCSCCGAVQLLWCRTAAVVQDSCCGAGQLLWCSAATVVQGSCCDAVQLLVCSAAAGVQCSCTCKYALTPANTSLHLQVSEPANMPLKLQISLSAPTNMPMRLQICHYTCKYAIAPTNMPLPLQICHYAQTTLSNSRSKVHRPEKQNNIFFCFSWQEKLWLPAFLLNVQNSSKS